LGRPLLRREHFSPIGECKGVTHAEPDILAEPGTPDTAWIQPESTDAALIECSRREPERFAEIFDRYYAEIHGYVSRRLGRSLADDLASETFLIGFGRRQRYDVAYQDARPWLYGIASNLIARHRRSELRQYRALARAGVARHADSPSEGALLRLDAQALRGRLAAALADISPRDREVLLLVAWAQLTCEEAARALGIPAGTARSRLHRSRIKVRAALADANSRTSEGDTR
jgi:RNA polymerase sigma factor (sigma-70 family)